MKPIIKNIGKVSLTPKGNYNSNENYKVLDTVNNENGKTFIAKKDVPKGITTDNEEYWMEISSGGKGDKGEKGDSGTIEDVTVTIDDNVGTPEVEITLEGTPENRIINLHFKNLKGETGAALNIISTLNSEDELPEDGDYGNAYLINGYLYLYVHENGNVSSNPKWNNGGRIKGDPFTYEDFTEEQLENIQKPAKDAANNANEQAEYAKSQGNYAKSQGDYAAEKANQALENSKEIWRPSVSSEGDLTWEKTSSELTPNEVNIKGPKGNPGITGNTSDIVVINDLNGGESEEGSIKVLAAEQGKALNEKITLLNNNVCFINSTFNMGAFMRIVPKEFRKPGLVVTYPQNSSSDKYEYKTKRYVAKELTDEKWNNIDYWKDFITIPPQYILTKERVYSVLPKGSLMFSTVGNIFGEDWIPANDILLWDNGEFKSALETKNNINILYAQNKCFVYTRLNIPNLKYSEDYDTWNDITIEPNKVMVDFVYIKSKNCFISMILDGETNKGYLMYSDDGITWKKINNEFDKIPIKIQEGKNTIILFTINNGDTNVDIYETELNNKENSEWDLIETKSFILSSPLSIQSTYDNIREKFIIIDNQKSYEKDDIKQSRIEEKGVWADDTYDLYYITYNNKRNEYIITAQQKAVFKATNKDTNNWTKINIAETYMNYILNIFCINDIYYTTGFLMATTNIENTNEYTTNSLVALIDITTDGKNIIGLMDSSNKEHNMYIVPLASVDTIKYGYIKKK